jgi:hypothetical protein
MPHFSKAEAATMIQRRYRAYEARKNFLIYHETKVKRHQLFRTVYRGMQLVVVFEIKNGKKRLLFDFRNGPSFTVKVQDVQCK